MIDRAADDWFAARTQGAPPALLARARGYFDAATGADLVARLSSAGEAALAAATRGGADRAAAIDVLAADALITLALRAGAEGDPASLGVVAAGLRHRAVPQT